MPRVHLCLTPSDTHRHRSRVALPSVANGGQRDALCWVRNFGGATVCINHIRHCGVGRKVQAGGVFAVNWLRAAANHLALIDPGSHMDANAFLSRSDRQNPKPLGPVNEKSKVNLSGCIAAKTVRPEAISRRRSGRTQIISRSTPGSFMAIMIRWVDSPFCTWRWRSLDIFESIIDYLMQPSYRRDGKE